MQINMLISKMNYSVSLLHGIFYVVKIDQQGFINGIEEALARGSIKLSENAIFSIVTQ